MRVDTNVNGRVHRMIVNGSVRMQGTAVKGGSNNSCGSELCKYGVAVMEERTVALVLPI
jgi:hypothetical protein